MLLTIIVCLILVGILLRYIKKNKTQIEANQKEMIKDAEGGNA